jgi:hypothetical protein
MISRAGGHTTVELAMPDLDLIKQGRLRRYPGPARGSARGRSGIPPQVQLGKSRPRIASARIGSTTHRRDFAADLLQMQQHTIIDSIDDCSLPAAKGAVIARSEATKQSRWVRELPEIASLRSQ